MVKILRVRLAFLLLCCGLVPGWAAAYSFDMSEVEFSNWPMYCQARYASLDVGLTHSFSINYSRSLIEQAREQLGAATFERVQHWCAGATWLTRARLQTDPKMREFQLNEAKVESLFTLRGLPPNSSIIPSIYVTLGLICQEQQDNNCASENFEKAIETRPTEAAPYSALALLHRKRKQLDVARDVLIRGDVAVGGQSAEIHYNLGLILLEMGDADGAVVYARKAYLEGYPLPGLKKKLKQLGRSLEPVPESVQPPQAVQVPPP